MSLDKQEDMVNTLNKVGEDLGVTFTPEEIKKFKIQKTFLASQ